MPKIVSLLLAAGHSSRMGQPKALLEWNQQPLILHQIKMLQTLGYPIAVVLGAHKELITTQLKDKKVLRISHPNYEAGMGSSIAAGISAIRHLQPEAVLILAVDQPLVTSTYLNELIAYYQKNQAGIVQSVSTEGWKGIPVIFNERYFDALEGLVGDVGAKPVVKNHMADCLAFTPSELLTDIDTYAQYQELKKSTHQS